MKKLILILVGLLALNMVSANENMDITAMADSQNAVLEQVLDQPTQSAFMVNAVWVLTKVTMTVEVPFIGKVTVAPEVDLWWMR